MYELMVISTVDGAVSVFEKVEKFLAEASAQNVKSEKMGKKLLAYKIDKQTEGEYFLFNFDADPSEILQLDRKIRLEQEAILRHMLVKMKPLRESKRKTVKEPRVEEKPKEVEAKVEDKPKVTVTTKVTTKSQSKPILQSKTSPAKVESKASKAKGKK